MLSEQKSTSMLTKPLQLAANHAGLDLPKLTDSIGDANRLKTRDEMAVFQAASSFDADSAMSLLATRQLCAMATKNPALKGCDPSLREAAAAQKFFEVMRMNARTTKRLDYFISHPSRMAKRVPLVNKVLGDARYELLQLLGPCPGPSDWDDFENAKVFSKGSVQGIAKYKHNGRDFVDVDAYAKLSDTQTFTSSSRCLTRFGPILLKGRFATHLDRLRKIGTLKVSERCMSQAVCVPKDARTDRFIAVEPMLNAMAQQGIRSMLDKYLSRWDIKLRRQEGNVKLARIASERGFSPNGFATIDLSSASDTITTSLVKYLLPIGWFNLLNDARTDNVEWKKEVHPTQSFSTMGNAFTFPLQCLIFSSLVRACLAACAAEDRRWKVYGDDIVIPVSASGLLLEVLRFVGFVPNKEKSFVTGFFRESCGGDFLGGYDVRPVYLKKDIAGKENLQNLHQFFNALQKSQPSHPVLPFLYNTVKRPLIGPAMGPAGGETSHFVAPVWLLRRSRMAEWNKNTQTYVYRYSGIFSTSHKRKRSDWRVRYITGLTGSYGRCHDVRGSQRLRIEQRCTSTPWIQARFMPLWYVM